jgi:hypothetical protein
VKCDPESRRPSIHAGVHSDEKRIITVLAASALIGKKPVSLSSFFLKVPSILIQYSYQHGNEIDWGARQPGTGPCGGARHNFAAIRGRNYSSSVRSELKINEND